jgi:TonB-linked SusC/RagA family outer membrane protein
MTLTAFLKAATKGMLCTRQNLKAMKLTAVFLLAVCLQVSATGFSQKISLQTKNAPFEKVLQDITKQSGYEFLYRSTQIKQANRVTVQLVNADFKAALDQVFKDQPFTYTIQNQTIVISPKEEKENSSVFNQKNSIENLLGLIDVKGRVVNENGEPISGVSVLIKGTKRGVSTDENGVFEIKGIDENAILVISGVNIETYETKINGRREMNFTAKSKVSKLEDVEISAVNTGYQTIPKERATGSFSTVTNSQLERRVATDIISKLNGITSGLVFNVDKSSGERKLTIRGLSTIYSNEQPLIVIDNFPYEGDINNINPNDVENITVLKDAAAASIWGVRASNGVIVITTKKGKQNQALRVDLTANTTIGSRPNVYYSPNYLKSTEFIGVEQFLFDRGYFDADLLAGNPSNSAATFPLVSPVVSILAAKRAGQITNDQAEAQISNLRSIDFRDQLKQYFYQPSIRQQYLVSLKGGNAKTTYLFSGGYDYNRSDVVGNNFRRITLRSQATFHVFKNFELLADINLYGTKNNRDNTLNDISRNRTPYKLVADANGNPLPIGMGVSNNLTDIAQARGFYNWKYLPLNELGNQLNQSNNDGVRANLGFTYKFLGSFTIDGRFQFEKSIGIQKILNDTSSFFTRDLINRFSTVVNGVVTKFNMPYGGIYDQQTSNNTSSNGRLQLNFQKSFGKHSIYALGGYELREAKSNINGTRLYGYDRSVGSYSNVDYTTLFATYPSGFSSIPNSIIQAGYLDRYRSVFTNFSYTYDNRYTITGSARKDESNYFGVNANQKGVPLWSAGVKWNASREKFYKLSNILPKLNVRLTYGYSGNVNKTVTSFTTSFNVSNAALTNATYQRISNAPNSELRWEKTGVVNLGIDFRAKDNILFGSIEFYKKRSVDILADKVLPASSGFINPSSGGFSIRQNTGTMSGTGFDIDIRSTVLKRKIEWIVGLQFSRATDRVTRLNINNRPLTLVTGGDGATGGLLYPNLDYPVYGVYSFKWAGLSASGEPQGYINGAVSTNYAALVNPTTLSEIVYHGPSRPTIYGGLSNTVSLGNFSLFFNFNFKAGYYFRKTSINYTSLFSGISAGHEDFSSRWQKPGDELITNVPALIYSTNTNRDAFYNLSEVLVDKADNVRLQDISLSYQVPVAKLKRLNINSLKVFLYMDNVGIIWKATKSKLDPDAFTRMPNPRTYSFGVNVSF